MTTGLIEHIESHLGRMKKGWNIPETRNGVSVALFSKQPTDQTSTYVTIGLDKHCFQLPDHREIRQELIFSAEEHFDSKAIASFLLSFSDYLLSKDLVLLRGQVVGPNNPIIPQTKMNAVYASIPVMFKDSFVTFKGSMPPTIFIWLIPIYAEEAEYISRKGWDSFEDILQEKTSNLFDLNRKSIT